MKLIDFNPEQINTLTLTEQAFILGGCCPGTPQEPIDPDPDDDGTSGN